MTTRVAICDDQRLVRDGLKVQLGFAEDLEVVGEAADGHEAVDLARRHRPDVMVMDIRMPGLDGIEATRLIAQDGDLSGVRVLILTTFDLDEHVYAALAAGASGFLLKDATPEEILYAVRVVASGESLLAPAVTSRLVREFAEAPRGGRARTALLEPLTAREREILALVGRGMSNADIASTLTLSHATVKTHVSRVLTKLSVRDRAQLVVVAYESGLVVPGR